MKHLKSVFDIMQITKNSLAFLKPLTTSANLNLLRDYFSWNTLMLHLKFKHYNKDDINDKLNVAWEKYQQLKRRLK